jgi:hypothetical protein
MLFMSVILVLSGKGNFLEGTETVEELLSKQRDKEPAPKRLFNRIGDNCGVILGR